MVGGSARTVAMVTRPDGRRRLARTSEPNRRRRKSLVGSNPTPSTIQSIVFCTFWRIASGKDFRPALKECTSVRSD